MNWFLLLWAILLISVSPTIAQFDNGPRVFEKDPEFRVSPEDERAIRSYWEQAARNSQEERLRENAREEAEAFPELLEIKVMIDVATAQASDYLRFGSYLTALFSITVLLRCSHLLWSKYSGLRDSFSICPSALRLKPLVAGFGSALIYVLLAAPLSSYLILPVFSGSWRRGLLQLALFSVGAFQNVVSGWAVRAFATSNKAGHASVVGAMILVLNVWVFLSFPTHGDILITIIALLLVIPLVVLSATSNKFLKSLRSKTRHPVEVAEASMTETAAS